MRSIHGRLLRSGQKVVTAYVGIIAEALAQAGGKVEAGPDRRSATGEDREFITGQQPFSDEEFSKAFVVD